MLEKSFGTYDIRGRYPDVVNEDMAYDIGRRFAKGFFAGSVVVGRDIRLSGPSLQKALVRGLTEAGCDVLDIGQCGTEMVYFATVYLQTDGGIMITASHNPKEYNGMKFVGKGAYPISGSTGLDKIISADEGILTNKHILTNENISPDKSIPNDKNMLVAESIPAEESAAGTSAGGVKKRGTVKQVDVVDAYVQHLLGYIDTDALKPLKIVANSGNGSAGPILDRLEKYLPFFFIKVNHAPDGNFPNGVPNPLLPDNRQSTITAVKREGADLGIAWDGDFDRCFFFDEKGNFIESYYIVGFLAEAFLAKNKGARIVHDPRLYWNTQDIVKKCGGIPVLSKSGHSIIKAAMRRENAVYGGEMSAHHYFRDFAYCDSGMISWLLVAELLSRQDRPMSALLQERMKMYPCSGEINSRVNDAEAVLARVENIYRNVGSISRVDGLSVELAAWRFNLRKSNTEPLIRLNVETRGDEKLLEEKIKELLQIIRME